VGKARLRPGVEGARTEGGMDERVASRATVAVQGAAIPAMDKLTFCDALRIAAYLAITLVIGPQLLGALV
jgi:hypothetical protein